MSHLLYSNDEYRHYYRRSQRPTSITRSNRNSLNRSASNRSASNRSASQSSRHNSSRGNSANEDSAGYHSNPNNSNIQTNIPGSISNKTKKINNLNTNNQNIDGTRNLLIDQNVCFLSTKEAKSTYCVLLICLHFSLLSMPFLNTAQAWTLTNVIHSFTMYYILHYLQGAPFARHDQGRHRRHTYWEQIDNGRQRTSTRKFYIVIPSIIFLLSQFYSMLWHTPLNILGLCVAVIPKLPQFHKFRLMDIKKYG